MQNIWLVGIVLSALVGSGAVMGLGAMDNHDGMHQMMVGMDHEDCYEQEDCEYEGGECLEHSDEDCIENHEDCDMNEHKNDHMSEHMEDHGCQG